jgi:hypothetical protein
MVWRPDRNDKSESPTPAATQRDASIASPTDRLVRAEDVSSDSTRSVRRSGTFVTMRRLISSSRNLMLDCDPKIAKRRASLVRFPLYSAPPQRTSRSCIALAPLAQLALDFLEGNVGEILSLLWRDATFEMRL